MRPRAELALLAGALVALGAVAVVLGSRNARPGDADPRRSIRLTGPAGARGFADALRRLGVRVDPWNERANALPPHLPVGAAFAVLDPAEPLSSMDARHLGALAAAGTPLLLAGPGTDAAMRCYGLTTVPAFGQSLLLGGDTIALRAVLAPVGPSRRAPRLSDELTCRPAAPRRVDTLLAAGGRAAAVIAYPDSGAPVTLVADGGLFANREVRESHAGEFVLGLVAGRYRRLVVDEYHQGFGVRGGLLGATLAWSARSPWGWALWQLAFAGLIVVAAGAVRFGPARSVIERRRRSALEHVHALAAALASPRGHRVAIRLLVQGLRRRIAPPGEPLRADPAGWLPPLAATLRTPRGRAAAADLETLLAAPANADAVRQAALDVEDVWRELQRS